MVYPRTSQSLLPHDPHPIVAYFPQLARYPHLQPDRVRLSFVATLVFVVVVMGVGLRVLVLVSVLLLEEVLILWLLCLG